MRSFLKRLLPYLLGAVLGAAFTFVVLMGAIFRTAATDSSLWIAVVEPTDVRVHLLREWARSFGPSAATIAIEKNLRKPISFDFQETPLRDVTEFMRDYTNLNIVLDEEGLQYASVRPDTEITMTAEQIPLKDALTLLLQPLHLKYTIKNEVLMITKDDTIPELALQLYPVNDLLLPDGAPAGKADPAWLIEVVTNTCVRDTWVANGGEGSIAFDPETCSLVVSQSSTVHRTLRGLLEELRRTRKPTSAKNGSTGS